MDFESLDEARKDALLQQIGRMYRYSELQLEMHRFQVGEASQFGPCMNIKERIDFALSRLSEKQAILIRNEYLVYNRKNWYLALYDEQTFRMYKKQSVNAMLHMLYG